jgi:hypothetical protein
MKFKVSDKTSLVALALVCSSTFTATALLAYERSQGSQLSDALEDAKGKFSLIKPSTSDKK